jgi:hypothetical protein
MEGLYKLASKIDIGFTLAEVVGDIPGHHKMVVNEETSTIDIYYSPCIPAKVLKIDLKIFRDKN